MFLKVKVEKCNNLLLIVDIYFSGYMFTQQSVPTSFKFGDGNS